MFSLDALEMSIAVDQEAEILYSDRGNQFPTYKLTERLEVEKTKVS
jgi:hypothetical protein